MLSAKVDELGQGRRTRSRGVVFGQSGCIRVKVVYSGKVVVLGAKVVVFEQKWLYSGKSGSIWEKRFYSGKSGCGPTATVTSKKAAWNEGPDQPLQGKRLSSKIYAAYAT